MAVKTKKYLKNRLHTKNMAKTKQIKQKTVQVRIVMSQKLNAALCHDLVDKPEFNSKAALANDILEKHYKLNGKSVKKPVK